MIPKSDNKIGQELTTIRIAPCGTDPLGEVIRLDCGTVYYIPDRAKEKE